MSGGTYTYEPDNVTENGKDRMRFELGDTMVEGASDTAALTDSEIEAAICSFPKSWKRAKLFLLESLYRRFSYEVDTRTGPLTLSLSDRAKRWKDDYDRLKAEIEAESVAPFLDAQGRKGKQPYFYTGMQKNERTGQI